MTTYRERREARAARLREWADKREVKADAASTRAQEMADAIPFGQPILVGHYSEGRDRRYRARIGTTMDRAMEHGNKARSMRSRADNIEAAAAKAIYSDDDDAVVRLAEKIDRLVAERARLVAYNKSCRKGARDASTLDAEQLADAVRLAKIGFLRADGAFPGYATSNLSGQISAARKRLAALKAKAGDA